MIGLCNVSRSRDCQNERACSRCHGCSDHCGCEPVAHPNRSEFYRLTTRQLATVIAALRQYQGTELACRLDATNGGEYQALTDEEIGELATNLNCG